MTGGAASGGERHPMSLAGVVMAVEAGGASTMTGSGLFNSGGSDMVPLYISMERREADSGVTAPLKAIDSHVCAQWRVEAGETAAERLSLGGCACVSDRVG